MVRDLVGSTATGYLNGPGIDELLVRRGSDFYRADVGSALRPTAYGFEPFGRASVTSGASTTPAQCTGWENDGTGLYYNRARYYHLALRPAVLPPAES